MLAPHAVETHEDAAARLALWWLAAGLLIAAAVAGVGSLVYSESGTTCQALLFRAAQRLAYGVAAAGDCEPYWNGRLLLVALLVTVALACGARAGVLSWRGRRQPPDHGGAGVRPVSSRPIAALSVVAMAWAVPVSGAVMALAYVPVAVVGYVLVSGYEGYFDSLNGLPGAWLHLTYAVGGMASCGILRRAGVTTRSTLTAVAVAVPVIVLANALLSAALAPPETELPDLHARTATMALAGVLFALAVVMAAWLQAVGRGTPPIAHSAAALLLSLWLVTPVLVESFRPGYDALNGGPDNGHLEPAVWVPLLAAPVVGSALLAARAARRRGTTHNSPPSHRPQHVHSDR